MSQPAEIAPLLALLEQLKQSPGMQRMAQVTKLAGDKGFDEAATGLLTEAVVKLAFAHSLEDIVELVRQMYEAAKEMNKFAADVGVST